MRDFSRRINTVEKQLNFGRHTKHILILPPLITSISGRTLTAEDEQKLGAIESWITYQEQLQAQEKANAEILKNNPDCIGCP